MLIEMAERGWLPDGSVRWGIRRMLARRLHQQPTAEQLATAEQQLADTLQSGPMVVHAADANRQHYEVPAEFFELVLGPHLKYSCGYWPTPETTLPESEAAMLRLTVQRADLHDGMDILELGCGWGSLSLWMAEQQPLARVTAVSNSATQKAFIERRAAERGLSNLRVITADIADFEPDGTFDRVVSVEMFEHVRNHRLLLGRIADWLRPDGRLFVHIFCHRDGTYLFETEGRENWMGRHFFTGGMMPSANWLGRFQEALQIEQQWQVDGRHYQRTSEAWLQKLDQHREQVTRVFARQMSPRDARLQTNRWRMFFMACAELFGYNDGQQWFVSHYRLRPTL